MRRDLATIGAANPYALAELVLGRRVKWESVTDPITVLEATLGAPRQKLFDPDAGSLIYTGLVPEPGGGLRKVPKADVATDIKRRLELHQTFTPSKLTTRPSPVLKAVLARNDSTARKR